MLNQISKSKVLILGFGNEGQATLRYLQEKFPEKVFFVADSNQNVVLADSQLRENDKIVFNLGRDYLKNLDQYDLILKSPGITSNLTDIQEFIKNGGKITSATNLFMSQVQGTVIGVTGSKGKSTTVSLLYAILKEANKKVYLIGNIGNPALAELKNDSLETFFVYEMSSYQLEDLEIKPQYALITNLFPEHLDYHGGVEKYYEAKMNIVKSQESGDKRQDEIQNKKALNSQHSTLNSKNILFYNAGSMELKNRVEQKNCVKVAFNNEVESKIEDDYLIYKGEKIIAVQNVPLLGKHNLENLLGVIAVGRELGVESEVIRKAVQKFKGLEHRLEYVGEFQGIRFYNDSISTTPESTIQGIQALGESLDTLIVGGLDRGYDFAELARVILKSKIRKLILFPETGEKIKVEILNSELKMRNEQNKINTKMLNFYPVQTMEDCVKIAYQTTEKGRICLLSPASPSYNLFKNFQERGSLYKKFIQN